MPGEEESQSSGARPGSPADVAHRLDRVERRQDAQAGDLAALASVVKVIELNQTHAIEMNKVRFDATDKALAALTTDFRVFMTRMEGVITGDIKTAAAKDLASARETAEREGGRVMAEWTEWREKAQAKLDLIDDERLINEARRKGVTLVLSNTKAVVAFLVAAAGPLVAVVLFILRGTQ